MPFCAECGSNLGEHAGKFCPECGQLTGIEPKVQKPVEEFKVPKQSVFQSPNRQPQPQQQQQQQQQQSNTKSNEYLPGSTGRGGNIDKNLSSAFGLEQNRPGFQPTMLTQTRDALTVGGCAKCGLGIQGNSIRALNAIWHEDCFTCESCGEIFNKTGNRRILEKDGRPWCEPCFDKKFGDTCGGCGKVIPSTGGTIKALSKTWHPECFRCTGCNKTFDSPGVYNKGGKPYCKDCVQKT